MSDEWTFHVTPWEREFLAYVSASEAVLRLACPFIKLRNIRLILAALSCERTVPVNIQLLTRLNLRDCRSRVHDLSALQLLLDNPVRDRCSIQVRIDNALHAKLYIMDDREVIVTSSNLTYSGFNRNREVALLTKSPDVIAESVKHFSSLFSRATPLEQGRLDEMYRDIVGSIPEATVCYEDTCETPTTFDQKVDSLEELDLDQEAIEAIEESVVRRFITRLSDEVICISGSSDESEEIDNLVERRFIEDLRMRFRVAFGRPEPTDDELAAIYVHASAKEHIRTLAFDTNRATVLHNLGQRALHTAVTVLLLEAATPTTTGGAVVMAANDICSSNHLEMQLESLGLCRAIVSTSTLPADSQDSEALQRGRRRVVESNCVELIGHLFLTRSWDEFLTTIRGLLDLQETFPFALFAQQNSKSRLQAACQALYGKAPKYEITEEEGPDHDKSFVVTVLGGGRHKKMLGKGQGGNRKQAEFDAARNALATVSSEAFHEQSTGTSSPLPDSVREFCRDRGARAAEESHRSRFPRNHIQCSSCSLQAREYRN